MLTDQTAKQLGEMLKTNTRLEGLSLWQNDLTAEVNQLATILFTGCITCTCVHSDACMHVHVQTYSTHTHMHARTVNKTELQGSAQEFVSDGLK